MKAKMHMFMPGETVSAAIKKYNLYQATAEEMATLLSQFKKLNQQESFKPGMKVVIPILDRLVAEVFAKK